MKDFNTSTIPSEYKDVNKILNEVISCYYNKEYRSAIVMLYVAVNYNLYRKLQNLRDLYNNNISNMARKVLKSVDNNNTDESKETTLLNSCKNNKLNLLDNEAKAMLPSLRRYRNCCVHPEFNDNPEEIIAHMDKATVYSLINRAINHIFSFKARSGNKIFSGMAKDLINHINDFHSFNSLHHYLDVHYLSTADTEDIKYMLNQLFRRVFLYSKKVSYNNKILYFKSLLIILNENPKYLSILNDLMFNQYENYVKIHDELVINFVEQLFITYPELYRNNIESIISQDVKEDSLFKLVKSNNNYKCIGNPIKYLTNYYIFYDDASKYIIHLSNHPFFFYSLLYGLYLQYKNGHKGKFQELLLHSLFYLLKQQNETNSFIKLISKFYYKSTSFMLAEYYFRYYIKPFLYYFNEKQLLSLIKLILKNKQCCNRNNAYIDHEKVVKQYLKYGGINKNIAYNLLNKSNKKTF